MLLWAAEAPSCSEPLEDHVGHHPSCPAPAPSPLGGRELKHLVTSLLHHCGGLPWGGRDCV